MVFNFIVGRIVLKKQEQSFFLNYLNLLPDIERIAIILFILVI